MLHLPLLLVAPALAHPFGGAMPGHDLHLEVGPEGVVLDYQAALPTHDLLVEMEAAEVRTEAQSKAFTEAKLDELAAGLRGRLDAEPATWERLDPERETGRGNQRLVRFEQRLRAATPKAPSIVTLSNGNLPDQLSYFRWTVDVAPSLEVLSCSLVDVEEGQVVETRYGQWRMDEPMRELDLRLRARRLPWMAPLLGESEAPRPVHEAMALGPLAALQQGVLSRELALAGLVVQAAAGALRAGRARWGVDALALVGVGLAALHAPLLAGAGVALYGLGAALTGRERGQGPLAAALLLGWVAALAWCSLT